MTRYDGDSTAKIAAETTLLLPIAPYSHSFVRTLHNGLKSLEKKFLRFKITVSCTRLIKIPWDPAACRRANWYPSALLTGGIRHPQGYDNRPAANSRASAMKAWKAAEELRRLA